MNPTSRAILQTILATDNSLLVSERSALQRLITGETEGLPALRGQTDERLLITQKKAAELMSVSRVTIWRMARDGMLHPVELLPGTWRYQYCELAALASGGTTQLGSASDK